MDRLAEAQVLITKRRRALAHARKNLKGATDAANAIKRELFVNRYGEAGYQRRANGAKKAGLIHAEKARAKKVGDARPLFVDLDSPQTQAAIEAITRGPTEWSPALPPVATQPQQSEGPAKCNVCHKIITTRGLCACPGKRHRTVRTIAPGPTVNIKHPPVPPFQLAAKEGAE